MTELCMYYCSVTPIMQKNLRESILKNYSKPEAWKTVFVCVYISAVYTTQTKTNELWHILCGYIYIGLYKMHHIHLKLEQSAVPVTPGTRQRRDSLYDILNYSSQTSPVLFLLVSVPRSNAAWQLALTDLHRNQIMTTGVLSPPDKSHPPPATFAHVRSGWSINWRWWLGGFT